MGVKGRGQRSGQRSRSKVNVRCLPGNGSLTNQPSTDYPGTGLSFFFTSKVNIEVKIRGQRSGSNVKVKGRGQRSIARSNVCQITID